MANSELKKPLVTIAIPIYNGEKFLEKTLNSILAQTYSNLEIIAVDNCSTDGTSKILEQIVKKSNKVRIVLNETTVSGGENFNKCLNFGDGEFLALFHSDDIYHPEIIEDAVKIFQNNEISLVGSLGEHIDENDKSLNLDFQIPKGLKNKSLGFSEVFEAVTTTGNSFLVCPTMIFRRSEISKIGNFECDKFYSAVDLALWLKYSLYSKIYVNDKKRIQYRLHNNQGSQKEVRDHIYIPDSLKVIKYYKKSYKGSSFSYNGYIAFHLMLTVWRRTHRKYFHFNKKLLRFTILYLLKSRSFGKNEIKTSLMLPCLLFENFFKVNYISKLVFEIKRF